jgi:hypothetical protein
MRLVALFPEPGVCLLQVAAHQNHLSIARPLPAMMDRMVPRGNTLPLC